jgi:hypothetical protein
MPIRKRSTRRRAELSDDAEAWLRGEQTNSFFEYKPWDELQAVWDRYGDHDAFMWHPPMYRPVARS